MVRLLFMTADCPTEYLNIQRMFCFYHCLYRKVFFIANFCPQKKVNFFSLFIIEMLKKIIFLHFLTFYHSNDFFLLKTKDLQG